MKSKIDEVVLKEYTSKQNDILNDYLSEKLHNWCGGYNGSIDDLMLNVLELSDSQKYENSWYAHIAKKAGVPEDYVELINYVLCSADLMEYGTSPRGAWLTEEGRKLLAKINNTVGDDNEE